MQLSQINSLSSKAIKNTVRVLKAMVIEKIPSEASEEAGFFKIIHR